MQEDALLLLARASKGLGLAVGLQTNGIFPDTVEALVKERLVDKIAIDYKTQWEGFSCVGDDRGPSCPDLPEECPAIDRDRGRSVPEKDAARI